MPRLRRWRRRSKPGAAPGTLLPDPTALSPVVTVVSYGPDEIEERRIAAAPEAAALIGRRAVTWINVDGLGDPELLQNLGEQLGLHRLALEDVINVHQRPKVEEYDDHLFIVTRMPTGTETFDSEQISLFLGDGYVLSFQERPGDCFDPVRARLRQHRGRIREVKSDYLAYALLDAVIDAYFPLLERYGEQVEELETTVFEEPSTELVVDVHRLRRDFIAMRRAIWPQRDMINVLIRDDSPFINDQTRIYLRDCFDHTIQLIDILESYRETATGLMDIYLSSASTRLNEVMKLLTIIATIFIPLGFIASLYGMNFDPAASPWNMPELTWRWGYPFALALMSLVGLALVGFFRMKGWIGGGRRSRRRARR